MNILIKDIIYKNNYYCKKYLNNYKKVEQLICADIKTKNVEKLYVDNIISKINTLEIDVVVDKNDDIVVKKNIHIFDTIKEIYDKIIDDNKNKLDYLLSLEQPAQRTKEWYDIRNNMLTASDLGKIIKDSRPGTKNTILLKKCGYNSDVKLTGKALTWGVKYEQVANDIYSSRNDIKVYEFGLIQHPTISHFGASPDGISEDLVMLEIKCPYSREINGTIPDDYYAQIQGQLEVCDLENCDYLECKLIEYSDYESFLNDIVKNKEEGNEYGVIIEIFDIKEHCVKYKYSSLCPTVDELHIWRNSIMDTIIDDDNLEYNTIYYWKCDIYSCTRVFRDKIWFNNIRGKLDAFWEEVLYYRKNINLLDTLISKKQKDKKLNI